MASNSAEVDQASAAQDRAGIIRDAIEREIRPLYFAISMMVKSAASGLRGDQLAQRVDEVLSEVVYQALAHPGPYQPGRPVVPWLIGIARNVLRGGAREVAGRPRQADFDDATWELMLPVLDPPDGAASARMDAEQMLSRLKPSQREAIVCRYWRGLDGRDLAEALGVDNVKAARARVFRAVQALRHLFASEVAL